MTLANILSDVNDHATQKKLSNVQVKSLISLKNNDGTSVLNLDEPSLLIEIVTSIQDEGYALTYEFLNANRDRDVKFLSLENPGMVHAQNNARIDLDIFKKGSRVETNVTCPRCNSPNQIVVAVQVRSADEPMTTFIHCHRCGRMPYNQEI